MIVGLLRPSSPCSWRMLSSRIPPGQTSKSCQAGFARCDASQDGKTPTDASFGLRWSGKLRKVLH